MNSNSFWPLAVLTASAFGQGPPAFDVAAIKANHSGSGSVMMRTSHGRLTVSNVTVRQLIQKGFHVKDSQIVGGPAWLDTERYDIDAKTERTDISDDKLWLSLQPLLADRFQLRFHRQSKQLPVYVLLIGKNGARLKYHTGDEQPAMKTRAGSGKAKLEATKTTMQGFADSLTGFVDRPVIDNTQLKGEYDFQLDWAQDHPGETAPSMLDSLREEIGLSGPTLFTAVQEQLGLKLQPAKGAVEIIVIDGAGKPSVN